MAVIPIQPIEVLKTTHGGPAFVMDLPEAASQTYRTGALLSLDFASQIAEASTTIGAGGTIANNRFAGIALKPGSSTTAGAANAKFAVATPETIFIGNVDVGQTATQINVGRTYGLEKDSSGFWNVDLSGGVANRWVRIVALDPRDNPSADYQNRVWFVFLTNRCSLLYTS